MIMPGKRATFYLPPKGQFPPGGPHDPLPYYYHPLVSRLYSGRINRGLSLLTPPYKSLLDVGYGSGLLLPTLFKICENLVAIDRVTDPASIMPILSGLGIEATLLKGDVASDGLDGKQFDLIVAFSVFEEVSEHLPVLSRIYEALKPGGELLVGMPRVDRIMEWLFYLIGYRGIEDKHIHTYKEFIYNAQTEFNFRLEKIATLPRFVPRFAALYFAMLFKKPD